MATALMRVRMDSRGQAVKRTILGHRDNYRQTLDHKKSKINPDAQNKTMHARKNTLRDIRLGGVQ